MRRPRRHFNLSSRGLGAILLFSLASIEHSFAGFGAFNVTASLATPRFNHGAELLLDGRVIVTGGLNTTAVASTELYDPTNGTWSSTGSLAVGRSEHTVTRLQSGKILVTGGIGNQSNVLSSAEIYDLTTASWSSTGNLITGRHQHRATLLASGKVLISGGLDGGNSPTAVAELYDPASGTFSKTGSLSIGRFGHTATLLNNGMVMVAGGTGASGAFLPSVEVFDPANGRWSTGANLTDARTSHTATLMQNGEVLVAGGIDSKGVTTSVELYDPVSNTWSTTASLIDARSGHTATLLTDGTILVIGGDGFNSPLASAEFYDPAIGIWYLTGSLLTARDRHTATLLNDGKIVVVGGGNPSPLTSVELYSETGLPEITSPLEAMAYPNVPFSYQVEATGAPAFDISGLPAGLSFDPDLHAIVGTPAAAGNFSIVIFASNAFGSNSATVNLTVQNFPTAGPIIISANSATGRTGSPFHFQVITQGGSPATTLATSGLPTGLSADAMTGEISGTVTTDGSYLVTLMATDGGITNSTTLELTFTSDLARPVIVSPISANVFPGIPFSYTIDAPSTDTFDPITYSEIGPLPGGLNLDPKTGIISGTPTSALGLQPSPALAGGVVTNVQMFACNPAGCCAQGLFFLHPTGAANISTRLNVGTGDNVLIGGFITQGNAPAKLVVRGIGPSLPVYTPLGNPYLELHDSSSTIASNDNWKVNLGGGSQEQAIEDTTLAPVNDLESAILAVLDPGAYTAIVRGVNDGIGVGLVEVFNLGAASMDLSSEAHLANISTRGSVQTNDNVMIGGFINEGTVPMQVLIRGIGPSLAQSGVSGALSDPVLEVHKPDGSILTNDNWQSDQEAAIMATTIPPSNSLESAILLTLPVGEGAYTAIVRGANNATGVGLVEAYFGNPCLGASCP